MTSTTSTTRTRFDRERHVKYFAHHLLHLPYPYSSLDTNRLTLVHFAAHALEMLGVWDDDDVLTNQLGLNKQVIIEWIYNLQIIDPSDTHSDDHGGGGAGFTGGTFLGVPFGYSSSTTSNSNSFHDTHSAWRQYHHGHIAMTYTALATLTLLGDDLSGVDKQGILHAMKPLQRPDGSFKCIPLGSEHDTRFLFCACAISYMLHDWSAVDIDKACDYIHKCRSFDGGIALIPGQVRLCLCTLYTCVCVMVMVMTFVSFFCFGFI